MRECLALALATQIGRTLTTELASEIVNRAFRPFDFAPIEPVNQSGWTLQTEKIRSAPDDVAQHRIDYLAERYPGRPQRTDWMHLMEQQERNALLIFTARSGGVLAASIWLQVFVHVDTGYLTVGDDLIYVTPAWRGSSVMPRLWRFAEQSMFERGVREVTFNARYENGVERMARFMGYTPVAVRVTKRHYDDHYEDAPTRHTTRGTTTNG